MTHHSTHPRYYLRRGGNARRAAGRGAGGAPLPTAVVGSTPQGGAPAHAEGATPAAPLPAWLVALPGGDGGEPPPSDGGGLTAPRPNLVR